MEQSVGNSEPDPERVLVMLVVGDPLGVRIPVLLTEGHCEGVTVMVCVRDCVIVGLLVRLTVIEELAEME